MILRSKGGYELRSKKGKPLGSFRSKKKAVKRLRQVEYFKKRGY